MRKNRRPTAFEDYKARALRDPGVRKALAEADDDPFLEAAYRLIVLRRELGLTQTQMAKRVRISQQSLARLESMRYKGHSLRSLDKVARAFGKRLRIEFVEAGDAEDLLLAEKRLRDLRSGRSRSIPIAKLQPR